MNEASELQLLTGVNVRTSAADALHQALDDVEARIEATITTCTMIIDFRRHRFTVPSFLVFSLALGRQFQKSSPIINVYRTSQHKIR